MSELLVELIRILPNPWQTRRPRAGDDQHVQDLAADIRLHGLLQIPLGRLVNIDDKPQPLPALPNDLMVTFRDHLELHVQLAFGHNRLAAFQRLAQEDPEHWSRMPVRLAEMDDRAMALAAWSENAARKDLSPLEAAQALQRLTADFGWTQEQVADVTGLARATVANKLRLLGLPEEQQKQLHDGTLSERQALSLLPIYDLPPAAQERLQKKLQGNEYGVRELNQALAHPEKVSSTDLREAVRNAQNAVSMGLVTDENNYCRSYFPVDREIDGVDAPACTACKHCLRGKRCADPACYERKEEAFERAELAFAVAATGLPQITREQSRQLSGYNAVRYFYPDTEGRTALQHALEHKCPRLHLKYEAPREGSYQALRVPDYPAAMYCCVTEGGKGECTCQDADKKAREAERPAENERSQKEAEKLREHTIRELTAALRAQDVGAWRAVLWTLRSYSYENGHGRDKIAHMDTNTTLENIARAVIKTAVNWANLNMEHGLAVRLAEWRKEVGWLPVAEETPASKVETEPEPEPGPGHCGAYCSHYSRTRNAPYCELRDCETTLGAKCAAKTKVVQEAPAADVAGEQPDEDLQPCDLGCVGFQSVGSGRYYCTLIDSEIEPDDYCQHYRKEAVDLVGAAVAGDEEEDL